MIGVIKEANGYSITSDKPLYCVQCGGLVVVANLRPKSCQVSFWTEADWAKTVEAKEMELRKAIGKTGLPLSDSFDETGDKKEEL